MFVRESKRVRHWVGRCHRGEDVHEVLAELARQEGIQAGWVEAIGAFESVELCEYDQEAQRYRPSVTFNSPMEVLSLKGNLSSLNDQCVAHLHASLSRETDNGVQVLGGHVQRARIFSLELRITSFDDVALVRELDEDTGLELWREPGPTRGSAGSERKSSQTPSRQRSRDERPVPTTRTRSRSTAGRSGPASVNEAEERPLPDEMDDADSFIERASSAQNAMGDGPSAPGAAISGVTWAMAAAASEEASQAALRPRRPERPEHAERPQRTERPERAKKKKNAARREAKVPAHRPPPIGSIGSASSRGAPPVQQAPREPAYLDEPYPEVGEYLDHRQFGLCKVEIIKDDGGVLLRMPNKRTKLIKLDVLQVLEPYIEGEKIIYPVRPRGPRKA